jgi:hypothetical protein
MTFRHEEECAAWSEMAQREAQSHRATLASLSLVSRSWAAALAGRRRRDLQLQLGRNRLERSADLFIALHRFQSASLPKETRTSRSTCAGLRWRSAKRRATVLHSPRFRLCRAADDVPTRGGVCGVPATSGLREPLPNCATQAKARRLLPGRLCTSVLQTLIACWNSPATGCLDTERKSSLWLGEGSR